MRRPALLLALALGTACRGDGAGEKIRLRFWGLGREGEVVQHLVAGFEQLHPGVTVEVQQIPFTAAHEKLLTAFVGEATPDLAQLGNTWVPEFAALNALEPLGGYVHRSPTVDSASFFPGIWHTNLIGDTLFGLPWYVDTRVVFYRRDLLRQAGYDSLPGSWQGWVQAMRAVKRVVGPGRYPIYLPTNEWFQPVIFGLQEGSPILKDGGRYGAFEDPAFRRAFDFYLSLYRDSLAPIAGLNDIANPYQEFARGYFTMWITGPWNLGEFASRLPDSLQNIWGTAPLPGPEGPATGVSLAGGSSLVIFRTSRHKALAWQLMEYLSSVENQQRFFALSGDLPTREDAWTDSLRNDRLTRAFWTQLHRIEPTPKVPEWEEIATKVYDYAEQSIRGGVPADTALRRLDRDVNQILEKRRWLLSRHAEREP